MQLALQVSSVDLLAQQHGAVGSECVWRGNILFSSSWQELSLKSTAPAHGFGGLHTIWDILPKALVKGPAAI